METSPHPEGTIGQPVMATVIQPPPIGYPPRRRSIFSRIISAFFVLIFIGSVLLNFLFLSLLGMAWFGSMDEDGRVQERFYSHQYYATDKVAILTIDGVIISGEGFFKQQIDHALKDAKDGHLKALVVRVNSPGGTMSGSDYMYHHLCELAKETNIPIVVSMGGIAASGGYYASMAVGDTPDTIFAEPTTWTGLDRRGHSALQFRRIDERNRRGRRQHRQQSAEGDGQFQPAHDRRRTQDLSSPGRGRIHPVQGRGQIRAAEIQAGSGGTGQVGNRPGLYRRPSACKTD